MSVLLDLALHTLLSRVREFPVGRTRVSHALSRMLRQSDANFMHDVVIADGVAVPLDCRDPLQLEMAMGCYEREAIDLVLQHLKPGDTFLDCGAHIGWFTSQVLARFQKSVRALAVEATSQRYQQLAAWTQLAARNGYQVQALHAALSDTPGSIEIHTGGSNTGFSTIVASMTRKELTPDVESVRALPLDQLARDYSVEQVGVMKLDVEGAEHIVLKGAQRLLEEQRIRHLLVEISPVSARRQGLAEDAVATLLTAHGYRGSFQDGRHLRPIRADDYKLWLFNTWWSIPGRD